MQVTYDPKETTFTKLLEAFAAQTDVTQMNRQGSDRGTQYRCGVYYHSEQQKADTEAYFQQLNEEITAGKRNWSGKQVVAEIKEAGKHSNVAPDNPVPCASRRKRLSIMLAHCIANCPLYCQVKMS